MSSFAVAVAFLAITLSVGATKSGLPHIVYLLTDDQGLNAVGYNNPQVLTPNIDSLATSGIILEQHYTYQYCSPTRTAFLTGRWPFKAAGTKNNIRVTEIDGAHLGFTFLPQRLKEAGYATHHVGKWHQGFADFRFTPTARGFDTSDGFFGGGQYHFNQSDSGSSPCPSNRITKQIFKNGIVQKQLQGIDDTDRFTDTALDIINTHGEKFGADGPPLFLYFAYNSPHSLIEVAQKYADLYPDISYPLQKTLYGMISQVDESIGKVVKALKTQGLWDNTILVFSADNGSPVSPNGGGWKASSVAGSNYPFRGSKSSNWEGGVRVPALVNGGYLPAGQKGKKLKGPIHIADWYSTFISLAGLDPTDSNPYSPSAVDGVNQWPWLSGQVAASQRNVVVLDHDLYKKGPQGQAYGAIIVGKYKLLIGSQTWSSWYGGPQNNFFTPNESVPNPPNVRACSFAAPCLFDLSVDPTEHNDITTQPGSAAIIADIVTNHWNPLYNDYHPPLTAPSDIPKYCQMLDDNQGFLAPYTQAPAPERYSSPTSAPTKPSAQPTAAPFPVPTANPSQYKICQYSGYCTTSADCVPGNKCTTTNLPYYSQCVPDSTTYSTKAGLLANYAGKCASTSQCADPGAYCDLTASWPQCHQPVAASGLCSSPNGWW